MIRSLLAATAALSLVACATPPSGVGSSVSPTGTADDSVMVLSGNSVEHALVMLGCYTAGVPIAPISPAYSLLSADHAKLKHCFATVRPKVVFAQDSAMFARAFETLKAQARTREFDAVTLPGATADFSYDLASSTIETNNIIGRLPGTTHPEETILYTAHWDHIGIGTPDANGDAIFNGAVDNATGTTALIEMARLFASGPRPERSIVLIGFTAEESGLLGSEFYAANPVYPLATTVAGFNIDGMNVIGPMVDVSVTGSGYSSLEDNLARHAAMQNRTVSPDSSPEAGYYFRSDHFPLAKQGVPMLYADGGTALVDGGRAAVVAAEDDYRANRYHQADDEWRADWNLNGMAQDIMLLYGIGLEIANSRAWPTWNEGTEFRPVRDRTASQRQ